MEVKFQEVWDLAKGNKRRIEKLEQHQEDQDKLLNTVARIAQKQDDMDKGLTEMKGDFKQGIKELKDDIKGDICEMNTKVEQIKEKPGKRWDAIVDKAILAVITGLVAFMMYKLGLA